MDNLNYKTIEYTVEFFSDWHCGSGLAAGADVDMLVIKDKNKLPFIPGKTLKGLIREAVENLIALKEEEDLYQPMINTLFGEEASNENVRAEALRKETIFFSNATLSWELQNTILKNELSEYLYRSLSSTALKNGLAEKHSLRKIQVTIPCQLHAKIHNVPEQLIPIITESFGLIKRMGQNRNRGLGRCLFLETTNGKLQ